MDAKKAGLIGCGVILVVGLLVIVMVAVVFGVGYFTSLARQSDAAAPAPPVSSGPTDPSTSTPSEVFVFTRNNEIYFVSDQGATPVRLTHGVFPALSPDGTRVAFGRLRGDAENSGMSSVVSFQVIEIATRRTWELMPTEGAMAPPAWSPDGSRLALVAYKGLDGRVILVDADGGTPFEAWANEEVGGMLLNPSWSTDGKSIYVHDMKSLVSIAPSGGVTARRPLTDFVGRIETVTSSERFLQSPVDPDLWAFTRLADGTPEFQEALNGEPINSLFVIDLSTGRTTQITPNSIEAIDPSWSNDGRSLLFCGYRDDQAGEQNPFRIWSVGIDGGDLREICRGESPDR